MNFFLLDGNLPFTTSLTLMLMIAILEGVMLVIGFGLSNILDSLLPDLDIDADLDAADLGVLSRFLAWLRIGEVPALMVLILFLTFFGLIGISSQLAIHNMIGEILPWYIAIAPVFVLTLPVVRVTAGWLRVFAVRDETDAIKTEDFLGKLAIITIGTATKGSPAEAKFSDRHGTTHYIMIQPDDDSVFQQGDKILITEKLGAVYNGIKNPNTLLN